MILTYFNDYLSYDKGLSIQMATLVVLLFGLGGGVGGWQQQQPLMQHTAVHHFLEARFCQAWLAGPKHQSVDTVLLDAHR